MKKSSIGIVAGLGLVVAALVGGSLQVEEAEAGPKLKVYKSATCGCCGDWIKHMRRLGFDVESIDVANIVEVKNEHGIRPHLQSCHTAVSKDGYYFEGHIPGKTIAAFLASPPKGAKGLTAPGMPMGSPGMEMGRFVPFDVLLVREDGTTAVFQHIDTQDWGRSKVPE